MNVLKAIVAVLGDGGPTDLTLADVLVDRGARPHLLSVDVGWLRSVRSAIALLDTAPGASAVLGLAESGGSGARIAALGTTASGAALEDWEGVCRRCGERNDITLVWAPGPAVGGAPEGTSATQDPGPWRSRWSRSSHAPARVRGSSI